MHIEGLSYYEYNLNILHVLKVRLIFWPLIMHIEGLSYYEYNLNILLV